MTSSKEPNNEQPEDSEIAPYYEAALARAEQIFAAGGPEADFLAESIAAYGESAVIPGTDDNPNQVDWIKDEDAPRYQHDTPEKPSHTYLGVEIQPEGYMAPGDERFKKDVVDRILHPVPKNVPHTITDPAFIARVNKLLCQWGREDRPRVWQIEDHKTYGLTGEIDGVDISHGSEVFIKKKDRDCTILYMRIIEGNSTGGHDLVLHCYKDHIQVENGGWANFNTNQPKIPREKIEEEYSLEGIEKIFKMIDDLD